MPARPPAAKAPAALRSFLELLDMKNVKQVLTASTDLVQDALASRSRGTTHEVLTVWLRTAANGRGA